VNTVAAQEWGSDYTDYYRVQGGGVGAGFSAFGNLRWQIEGSIEQQDSLRIHARPVVGTFEPTIPAISRRVLTAALRVDRPPSLSFLGTEVAVHGDARIEWDLRPTTYLNGAVADHLTTIRGAIQVNVERPFGVYRLVSRTIAGDVGSSAATAPQDLIYNGGPVTAPGYDYHSLIARAALGQQFEWQMPIPFPAFSLGRFGRVPATATIAPYVSAVATARFDCNSFPVILVSGRTGTTSSATQSCIQGRTPSGTYPSMGIGFLTPFNLLRLDVARGVGRGGRWVFYLDISREYWRIL
jgi:hypothetical protein